MQETPIPKSLNSSFIVTLLHRATWGWVESLIWICFQRRVAGSMAQSAAPASACAARSRSGSRGLRQDGFCVNSLHFRSANTPRQFGALREIFSLYLKYSSAGRGLTNVASCFGCFCFQHNLPGLGRPLGELSSTLARLRSLPFGGGRGPARMFPRGNQLVNPNSD